jgi:hypothetical protein
MPYLRTLIGQPTLQSFLQLRVRRNAVADVQCCIASLDPRWTRRRISTKSCSSPSEPFACIGVDPDMNGALTLVLCNRRDSFVQQGSAASDLDTMVRFRIQKLLSAPEPVAAIASFKTTVTKIRVLQVRWCKSGMSKATAHMRDMPLYHYKLASGRQKRRVCATTLNTIIKDFLTIKEVQDARNVGRLLVVIERPSPMPNIDGWQSAALSGKLPDPSSMIPVKTSICLHESVQLSCMYNSAGTWTHMHRHVTKESYTNWKLKGCHD